jgi:hypothetical protein
MRLVACSAACASLSNAISPRFYRSEAFCTSTIAKGRIFTSRAAAPGVAFPVELLAVARGHWNHDKRSQSGVQREQKRGRGADTVGEFESRSKIPAAEPSGSGRRETLTLDGPVVFVFCTGGRSVMLCRRGRPVRSRETTRRARRKYPSPKETTARLAALGCSS